MNHDRWPNRFRQVPIDAISLARLKPLFIANRVQPQPALGDFFDAIVENLEQAQSD